jgi:hypothetical protein
VCEKSLLLLLLLSLDTPFYSLAAATAGVTWWP